MIGTLLSMVLGCSVLADERISKLGSEDTSNVERDALVESLQQSEISTTAAPLLALIRDHVSPSIPAVVPKPWMDDRYPHRAKVWYASLEVWDELFRGRSDPAKARVLLELLHNHQDNYSRYLVFLKLKRHWTDGAEEQIARLLEADEISDSTKLNAMEVLLEQVGEKYVPRAIHFIQDSPQERKERRFLDLFNVGNKFFKYSRQSRDEIVTVGFEILEVDATPNTSKGHFLATQLGYFLQVPGGFKPDQSAPRYQGKNGLKKSFFADIVTNAMKWRSSNQNGSETLP